MIIFNFDVIAKPADQIGQRQPDSDGRSIWNMFHDKELGRICLIVNQDYDKELFEQWLRRESFKAAMYEFIDFKDPVLRAERIHTISGIWGRAKWYVDNDARVCAETLKRGIPTLLVASPYIIRPEWAGTRELKTWDTLTKELDDQAMKASDKNWREVE
jgi:hypothetical protein